MHAPVYTYIIMCTVLFLHTSVSNIFLVYFKSLLKTEFCETNASKRAKEEATYMFLLDFIEECEGNGRICDFASHFTTLWEISCKH